jgi:hypothetical protein
MYPGLNVSAVTDDPSYSVLNIPPLLDCIKTFQSDKELEE